MIHKQYDKLEVNIYDNRKEMGSAAGRLAADCLRKLLAERSIVRMIVASAPSQTEKLEALAAAKGIDWGRVDIFHMDEYVGISADHSSSFRSYQREVLLSKVTPRFFHGIRGETTDIKKELERYSSLLTEKPIDLLLMGIGENGHIAFNDPHVADFHDLHTIKIVELDTACRQQQVNDGCFLKLEDVPTHAFTLTCPALMSSGITICTVPGILKADAVYSTMYDVVSTSCPSTILRHKDSAYCFLDRDSASRIIFA